MSIQENKRIAREFFEALGRGDQKAVLNLYAVDGTCWTAGSLPFSGTRSVAEAALLMEGILSAFPDGLGFLTPFAIPPAVLGGAFERGMEFDGSAVEG